MDSEIKILYAYSSEDIQKQVNEFLAKGSYRMVAMNTVSSSLGTTFYATLAKEKVKIVEMLNPTPLKNPVLESVYDQSTNPTGE